MHVLSSFRARSPEFNQCSQWFEIKTRLEQEKLCGYHIELEDRLRNGEADLNIMYWDGVPCVLKTRSKTVTFFSIAFEIKMQILFSNSHQLYQNCRGLRTNLIRLNSTTSNFDHTYNILTETWHNNDLYTGELGLIYYNTFICDRS